MVGPERLRRVRREEALPRRVDDDVGGQVLEVRARIDVRGPATPQSVRSGGAALDRSAAAVLDPEELRNALVNSWLPTEAKSTFIRLLATVIGSSKKSPFASGLAPMLSPAKTVAS